MKTQAETNMTTQEALSLLKAYSCIQIKPIESDVDKEQLRQALILIASLSEYENLGICADNSSEGFAALSSYLTALGYQTSFDEAVTNNVLEPVYIKFNTQKMSYYLDRYSGTYRGVLISCQCEDDHLSGTYGHFPLDLFFT